MTRDGTARYFSGVAISDLQEFVSALERDGDLKRIRARVDPHLEVTGIVQRVRARARPGAAVREPDAGTDAAC